jgi:hypothetical protein
MLSFLLQEKNVELLDVKCYVRLNEVASSLIKMAPYDQESVLFKRVISPCYFDSNIL